MNQKIKERIAKLKKMNLSGTIDWEIDYSELKYYLNEETGKRVKPFLFVIAHPESLFVIKTHMATPDGDYLAEFLYESLDSIENSSFCPKRILTKKKDLFYLFSDALKDLNIDVELVKRTPAVQSFRRQSPF